VFWRSWDIGRWQEAAEDGWPIWLGNIPTPTGCIKSSRIQLQLFFFDFTRGCPNHSLKALPSLMVSPFPSLLKDDIFAAPVVAIDKWPWRSVQHKPNKCTSDIYFYSFVFDSFWRQIMLTRSPFRYFLTLVGDSFPKVMQCEYHLSIWLERCEHIANLRSHGDGEKQYKKY